MCNKQQSKTVFSQTFVLIVLFIFFINPIVVQGQESCVQKLESAEELYEIGQINKVPPLLKECLDNGFTRSEKVRAYRLLTLCHLYYNENEKAAKAMGNLLKVKPEYVITESDPTEFSTLHETFRTTPFFILGAKAGIGGTDIYEITNFNDLNSLESEGVYTPGLSYSIGLSGETPILNAISLGYEVYYHQFGYKYEDLILNYAAIEFEEQLTSIEIPLFSTVEYFKQRFFTIHLCWGKFEFSDCCRWYICST
jgi:hypothetical protein